MIIPDRIDARWISTLGDEQLMTAEAALHDVFRSQERAEKDRTGTRYILLHGPATLVNAWHRWMLVNNETTSRGLSVHRRG